MLSDQNGQNGLINNGDLESEKLTITVPQAGRALGIGRNAAYEAARNGQLPTIRIGKRLLVPIVAFKRLLTGV
jgi:Helix-turn-helix domain